MENKSELDKMLFEEFTNKIPDENVVRKLIAAGANINVLDSLNENILRHAIFYHEGSLDLKFYQLLIDLGVDLNHATPNGFNCLFEACLSRRPALLELLLKAGSNPNCVDADSGMTILGNLEFDYYNWPFESPEEKESVEVMLEILKKYGAKYSLEDDTNK